MFTPEALRHLVAQVGVSQIMLGTDHPFPWEDHPVDAVLATTLSDDDKAAILGGNAARLFGMGAEDWDWTLTQTARVGSKALPGSRHRHIATKLIELLVKVARSSEEDAEASYDYLRRIKYFEPSSKVSRTKLRNLVAMKQRAGTVNPAFAIDRLVMPSLTELTD